MPVQALRPHDPRVLGQYQLTGLLGQGGMGAVYQARNAAGQLVAVKVIRSEFAAVDEFRGRFRSEVNRARQVPPFSTAAVLDADPEHATPYLVVEYVDGPDLADVVTQQGPLTGGALHGVAVGVATALVAIHGAGVVHRDLKPRNVLLALGAPKVIDFGIARALDATSEHTRTGQVVGTVSYMAPERLDGPADRQNTPAVDIFAWGAVVAYAALGRTPFGGDSPTATAIRILTAEPDLGDLDGPLREIVRRTLAKDPADRPTAEELLAQLLTGTPAVPGPDPEPEPDLTVRLHTGARRTGRRRKLIGIAAGAALLAAGAVGVPLSMSAGGNSSAASPSAGPAAPPAALPSAGPSTGEGGLRLAVADPLTAPGTWREVNQKPEDDSIATYNCTFAGAGLAIGGDGGACPGPETVFRGDLTIKVDITILEKDSCGTIGVRSDPDGPNQWVFELCDSRTTMFEDNGTGDDGGGSTFFGNARDVKHHVQFDVRGKKYEARVDGTVILSGPLAVDVLRSGPVTLGASSTGPRGSKKKVVLSDVEIWTS